MSAGTEAAAVERRLAQHGWALPADPLALEIIEAAINRWGLSRVLAGLERELAGDLPSYALEPIGRALGDLYECPHQLVGCALDNTSQG